MSIATALQTAQQRVASAYSSVSTKGGTLPATQNLNNLPSAIESIPSGGGSKYGCTVDNLLGGVNASGVLQLPSDTSGDIVFSGVRDIVANGLVDRFRDNINLTHGVSFPDLQSISNAKSCQSSFEGCENLVSANLLSLTTISGQQGCQYMFNQCRNLISANLSNLTTISGSYGCGYMFQACVNLSNISMSSLRIISGNNGCNSMLTNCQKIESIVFSSLNTISGSYCCQGMFGGCIRLSSLSFPSLTTSSFGSYINQFNGIFNFMTAQTSGTCTVHFPSNLSATIAGLTGYPTFGGNASRIVLSFDLPETS